MEVIQHHHGQVRAESIGERMVDGVHLVQGGPTHHGGGSEYLAAQRRRREVSLQAGEEVGCIILEERYSYLPSQRRIYQAQQDELQELSYHCLCSKGVAKRK